MFEVSQVVAAPPAQVVRAFTEPEPFAAWFVADGFRTPADRVRIDPRAGGSIEAVFVSDEGEIPFALRFGELELPHRVEWRFDEPAEEITVELRDLDGDRTRIDYRSTGLTAEQESSIRPGVAKMLGFLAEYFR